MNTKPPLWARFLLYLLQQIPFQPLFRFAAWVGLASYYLMPERRGIALQNLDQAFGQELSPGQKQAVARQAFQSASLSIMELALVQRMAKEARQRFQLIGNDHLEKAFERGNGVILVIAHLGSWEYLSFLPFLTQRVWSVIVKNLRQPGLNQMMEDLRKVMTVKPISKDAAAVRIVFQELKKNHGIAILIDQWAGHEGMWTPFFGRYTSTTSMPARLAERHGAALIPAYCLRVKPGFYEIHIEPEIPFDQNAEDWERTATEKLNRKLEALIREHPGQWLWGHQRWKPKPSVSKLRGEEKTWIPRNASDAAPQFVSKAPS